MDEWLTALLSGFTVFCTHLLEGITGFGSSVLALPFLTPLIGLKNSIPLLCVLNWFMAVYLVWRSWRAVSWKEFAFILLWVGLGLPAGLLLFEVLPAQHLCVILGAAMIVIGADGSRKCLHGNGAAQPAAKRNIFMRLLLFCGGIIQGAFGTGGPFIVIYAAKALPDKSLFRVTLSLLWLVTNSVRLIVWTVQGNVWNPGIGLTVLAAFPFMIAGVLTGDFLHRKVNEFHFRLCVYIILCAAGAVMLVNNLRLILA
ncbi:MAG: sulfite exporter TauE/SafE family protein [Lentisphaeria bacterium]|nr:sulfite exporter TauE/SafE family protein [Lentisphaeria bacterium]